MGALAAIHTVTTGRSESLPFPALIRAFFVNERPEAIRETGAFVFNVAFFTTQRPRVLSAAARTLRAHHPPRLEAQAAIHIHIAAEATATTNNTNSNATTNTQPILSPLVWVRPPIQHVARQHRHAERRDNQAHYAALLSSSSVSCSAKRPNTATTAA